MQLVISSFLFFRHETKETKNAAGMADDMEKIEEIEIVKEADESNINGPKTTVKRKDSDSLHLEAGKLSSSHGSDKSKVFLLILILLFLDY